MHTLRRPEDDLQAKARPGETIELVRERCEADFMIELDRGRLAEDDWENFSTHWLHNRHHFEARDTDPQATLDCDLLVTFLQLTRPEGTTTLDRQPQVSTEPLDPPADMSDAGGALYGEVAARARDKGIAFLAALDQVAQRPLERDGLDLPPGADALDGDRQPEVGGDRAELYRRAGSLAIEQEIGYMDAVELADLDRQLEEARADDGSADAPWLDSSAPLQPRPWSDEDRERDLRRAKAAGVEVGEASWRARRCPGGRRGHRRD